MTKGDIIRMPSGKLARYEGGTEVGAKFVYVDETGTPLKDPTRKDRLDVFYLSSIRLLTRLNHV